MSVLKAAHATYNAWSAARQVDYDGSFQQQDHSECPELQSLFI